MALILTACGRPGANSRRLSLPATTGFTDRETGLDYVHNGDTRVEQALREEQSATQGTEGAIGEGGSSGISGNRADGGGTANGTGAVSRDDGAENLPLREILREFEISRYDENVTAPSRFGAKRFRVKFFMRRGGGKAVEFVGEFGGTKPHLTVDASASDLRLTGFIDDQDQQSKGEFQLSRGSDTARIFYWAYRARMRVREDRTRVVVPGSSFDQQLRSLRENTFGWVHNWTVVRGRAFYMIDIVRVVSADQVAQPALDDALFSFKGESLRTGENVHTADVVNGNARGVQLVGNSEQGAERMFAVTFADPSSQELNEVMIDIDLDQNNTAVYTADEPIGASPGSGVAQGPEQEPVTIGDAYLRIDLTKTRTAKMTGDFNRNRDLEGVKAMIRQYQGGSRGTLTKFFKFANPFRRIMEVTGSTFDVSPAYAYLTVVESAYFTGGEYVIQRPRTRSGTLLSSALGPFQILEGTAEGTTMGMHVTDLWKNDPDASDDAHDERRYFVPSACGAARYMKYLVNLFDDSDSTLSILGYFQGEGGAAAAIYCVFDSSVADRDACVRRINNSYSGSDYGRFMRLAKNYNYTYAEMERRSAGLTQAMRDYVNKKLAVYFIANDMRSFDFAIPSDSPRTFNDKARPTVMPSRRLNDSQCEAAVRPIL